MGSRMEKAKECENEMKRKINTYVKERENTEKKGEGALFRKNLHAEFAASSS